MEKEAVWKTICPELAALDSVCQYDQENTTFVIFVGVIKIFRQQNFFSAPGKKKTCKQCILLLFYCSSQE